MKQNKIKCYHCGTEYIVKPSSKNSKCPHCGKEMEIDKQTGIRMFLLEIFLYVMVIATMIIPLIVMNIEMTDGIYAIFTLGFIFIFVLAANTIQKLSLIILHNTKGLTYTKLDD